MTLEFLRRRFLQALSLAAATLPVMISVPGWFRLLNENTGSRMRVVRIPASGLLTHADLPPHERDDMLFRDYPEFADIYNMRTKQCVDSPRSAGKCKN
ncbi:hypothetical protein ACC717_15475 [Rhizobium ruizarguesonis]